MDSGATGTPVALRTAAAANGDAVVVWLANDGTRNNLWANRFSAASGRWGTALNIDTSSVNVAQFDVTADGSGNLIVVWIEAEPNRSGPVFSTRFYVGAATWSAPYRLADDGINPRVASDASGNALALWSAVNARFFDAATRLWLAQAPAIDQNLTGTGASDDPLAAFDAEGNALAVWRNGRASAQLIASNHYRRSTGQWNTLLPGELGPIGVVPNSLLVGGFVSAMQLAALPGGAFQLVWQAQLYVNPTAPLRREVRAARFSGPTQTWSNGEVIVPPNAADDVTLQRLAADTAGNAIVLWTQTEGTRTALFALHARAGAASWDSGRVIDSALGGGAANADVAYTSSGTALAVWQQFEGGRPDDGSRSHVAANRYDVASDTWTSAIVAESQPGNAFSPRISTARGTVIAWIQRDGTADRVKALRP